MTEDPGRGTHPLGDGSGLRAVALVVGLALLLRLVFLLEFRSDPTFADPIIDASTYHALGVQFASTREFSDGFFWQSFLYPLFLALLYGISGNSILLATLVQILLGSLTCGLVYLTARSLYSRRAALVAGVCAAAYGPLIFIDAQHLPSQLATSWVMLYLYAHAKSLHGTRNWHCFLMGFSSGCAILTRGNLAAYFALSNSYLIYSLLRGDETLRTRIRRAGVLAASCAVVLVPAALLFQHHTGNPLPLPYSSGLNLLIGNDRRFPDRMAIRPGAAWELVLHEPYANGARNPAEYNRYFNKLFIAGVREDPRYFLRGLGLKTVQFFSSRELPGNFDVYLSREYSRLGPLLTWKAGMFGFPFGLLLPLAVVGLIHCRRQTPLIVLLYLLAYPATIILVHNCGRYRIPLIPVCLMLGGAGACRLATMLAVRDTRGTVKLAALCAAIAVACSQGGPYAAEMFNYAAEKQYCLGTNRLKRGEFDKAVPFFERAAAMNPSYADAQYNLGFAWAKQNSFDRALPHFKKALDLNPRDPLAYHSLGLTYLQLQQPEMAMGYLRTAHSMLLQHGYRETADDVEALLKDLTKE